MKDIISWHKIHFWDQKPERKLVIVTGVLAVTYLGLSLYAGRFI